MVWVGMGLRPSLVPAWAPDRAPAVVDVAALPGARGASFLADEPCDRVEPRSETGAVGQTLAHAEGAQEGLLHGVLSVLDRARTRLLAAEREDHGSVSVVEPSARFPVAGVERGEVGAVVVHGRAHGVHMGVVSDSEGICGQKACGEWWVNRRRLCGD
jgi:hypothetical protein